MSTTPCMCSIPKTDADVGEFFTRLAGRGLPADLVWTASQVASLGTEEQDAANKAAAHADTPSVAHVDSLGRTFLTIADNATCTHGEVRDPRRARHRRQPARGHRCQGPRSSCATTTTCSARGSIRPAWRPASAGC